ncbi:hypothetical protein CKJ62_04935 [Mycobacterium avium]|nr:hypothetical protein CKJ62_04935 [Mycobacterium avium]
MVVSPQRLTRWPSYVRDRHAAITYTTPRDAPETWVARSRARAVAELLGGQGFRPAPPFAHRRGESPAASASVVEVALVATTSLCRHRVRGKR